MPEVQANRQWSQLTDIPHGDNGGNIQFSMENVSPCPDPFPQDACHLWVNQPNESATMSCASPSPYDFTSTMERHNPSETELQTSRELLDTNGYTEFCRSGTIDNYGRYALYFKRNIFPACDAVFGDTNGSKAQMNIRLTDQEAAYLAGKFGSPDRVNGCTLFESSFLRFRLDHSPLVIGPVIASIEADVRDYNNANNPLKLHGISIERSAEIVRALNEVRNQNPTVITDKSTGKGTRNTFWATFTSVVVSVGTFLGLAWLFKKNTERSIEAQAAQTEKILAQNREIMSGEFSKVTLQDITIDMVEEERAKLAENRALNEIMGRDAEAIQYLRGLARPEYANPLLLGETGVGKDMIVKRAAQLIALQDPRVPQMFLNGSGKLLYVRSDSFQAGTGIRGSSAARAKLLIDAMKSGNFIYSPELVDAITSGIHSGGNEESLSSLLKPVLDKPWARWSGSTTPENYARFIRLFRDHQRRFPVIEVRELPIAMIKTIISTKIAPWYASHYNIEIQPAAVDEAVRVGIEYYHNQRGVPKVDAIKSALLDGIELAMEEAVRNGEQITVSADQVRRAVEKKVNNPGNPDDQDPPPAAAGGGGVGPVTAPSGEGAGDAEGASARSIEPWFTVPSTIPNGYQLTITTDPSLSFQARTEMMVSQIREAIVGKAAVAVTPEGLMFRVSVEGEDLRFTPAEQRSAVVLSEGGGTNWKAVGSGIAGGLIAGTVALLVIENYEDNHGHPMPWYAEAAAFLGTGTAVSVAETLAMGAPLSLTSIAYGIPVGLPASVVGFGATARYGQMFGFEGRDNRWFSIITGSVLISAAFAAEFGGGTTVAAMTVAAIKGGSLLMLGEATLAGAGVVAVAGVGLLAGGGIGYGIDEGLGELGVCNSSGSDCSLTGYLAEKMADTWEWCPDSAECYNPINWFF